MATKISALNSGTQPAALASGDLIAVTDVSDTAEAASGTTKPADMQLVLDFIQANTLPSDIGAAAAAGQVFSGAVTFSGTGHAGITLNSLTTTQRDALTPSNGMAIYNSTAAALQVYYSAAWNTIASGIAWSTAVNSNILPDTDSTYTLGDATHKWSDGFFDQVTIGGIVLDGTTLADPNADRLLFWDDSAGSVAYLTLGNGLGISTTTITNTAVEAIEFVIDGGGSAITTGVKGYLEIPFACTINRATALCDQSGSIVVDIWKDTYANYPPTDADSITAAAPVTVSTATKSQDSTLTGWTTSISAGDILGFNVDSITTCTRVTVSLKVTRT